MEICRPASHSKEVQPLVHKPHEDPTLMEMQKDVQKTLQVEVYISIRYRIKTYQITSQPKTKVSSLVRGEVCFH